MLSDNQVRIQYLLLLYRLPSHVELLTKHISIDLLNENIYKTVEYLQLNSINFGEFQYSNDIITLSNIYSHFSYGVKIGNGLIECTTTSEYNTLLNNYMNHDGVIIPSYNICDVRLLTTEYIYNSNLVISNHNQLFNMKENVFTDTLDMTYMGVSNVSISVDKMCLCSYTNCIVHAYTISNLSGSETPFFHCLSADNDTEFNTDILNINDNIEKYVSTIKNKQIECSSIYVFGDSNFVYEGHTQLDDMFVNNFTILGESITLYIISCFKVVQDTNFNTFEILLALSQNTYDTIRVDHLATWDHKWKTNIEIERKNNLTTKELIDTIRFESNLKLGLYKLYASALIDDFVFMIPALVIIKPDLAKTIITRNVKRKGAFINSTYYNNTGGIYFKTEKELKKSLFVWNTHFTKYIYQTALVSISIWNYFRATNDSDWLVSEGFPIMKRNAQFIAENVDAYGNVVNILCIDPKLLQTNNTLTNFLMFIALQFTISASYELNYTGDAYLISTLNRLKRSFGSESFRPPPTITDLSGFPEICIKVEYHANTYMYVLYVREAGICTGPGYSNYGGLSGNKIRISHVTKFYLDETVNEYPILFIKTVLSTEAPDYVVGYSFTRIKAGVLDLGDFTGIGLGVFVGFKYDDSQPYDRLKVNFETFFNEDAFILDMGVPAPEQNSILKLNSNIDVINIPGVPDIFLLFSELYFNEDIVNTLFNKSFLDIITDTSSFYNTMFQNTDMNNIYRSLIEGRLAQVQSTYNSKRNAINKFFRSVLDLENDSPFGGKYSSESLYALLTSVCCFDFKGEMSSTRFMLTDYGIVSRSKNVMPVTIKKLSVNNVGYLKSKFTFINVLYNDQPLLDERFSYLFTINDIEEQLTIHVVSGNGETPTFLINSEIEPNTTFGYSNPYTLHGSSNVPKIIDELSNMIITLPYIIPPVVKNFTTILDNTGSVLTNPTIHGNLSYIGNKMRIDMVFNTQNQHTFELVQVITANLHFNERILNNAVYNSSSQNSNYVRSISSSNISFETTLSSNVSGSSLYIGILEFDLDINYLPIITNGYFPIWGDIESSNDTGIKNKKLHIDNISSYPPTIFFQNMLPEFIYPLRTLELPQNVMKYSPIYHLIGSGNNAFEQIGLGGGQPNIATTLRELEDTDEINTFLEVNSLHIKNIFSSTYHSIILVGSNSFVDSSNDKFYAIGLNNSNNLMTTDTYVENDVTLCEKLHNFLNTSNFSVGDVKTIKTNVSGSMILMNSNNVVYAVGGNSDYNLCVADDADHSEIMECTVIKSLLSNQSTPTSIVNIVDIHMTDTSTTLHLDNNKFFSIGTHACFDYASEIKLIHLNEFSELKMVSNFLDSNGGTVERMDGGHSYFRFLCVLANLEKQWWGFGQNQYGAMGAEFIKNSSDEYMSRHYTTMTRLTKIEELIHGREFDESYKGPVITEPNSYELLSQDGTTSYHNFLIDTVTNEIYKNGKTQITEEQNGWRLWDTWENHSSNNIDARFFKNNNHGIFIGVASNDIYNYY